MFSEMIMILMSIVLLVVSGFGYQCYNTDTTTKKWIKNSMLGSMIFGIVGLFISIFMLYSSARVQGAMNAKRV